MKSSPGNGDTRLHILLFMTNHDEDARKGALEQDRRDERTNTSLSGQLPHRTDNRLVKASDSDFPEPGSNEEHTGEPEAAATRGKNSPRDEACDRETSEAPRNDGDPGQRQTDNRNQKKDDPRAA